MNKKKIVIIGLGGVGGYFGFHLNESNQDNHLTFVARGETYHKIKQDGLTLVSPKERSTTRPDAVYESISDLKNPDLVLICVKEYDLENVCRELKTVISPDTIILPMLNGADIYERIRKVITGNIILPSCVYIAAHIKQKGVVEYSGHPGKIVFGRDPEHFSTDVKWVEDLIAKSGIKYDFQDNADSEIWKKFMLIAGFGLVTAKYNSSIGTVCTDPDQQAEAQHILEEIKKIADKKGIKLKEGVVANTFRTAETFKPDIQTSLQRDINSGSENNELEVFAGSIIRFGKELNIETPYTQQIYTELKSKITELKN